jgi:hypothetical protein
LSVEDKETETKKETQFQMPACYPFHVLLWIFSFQLLLHALCWAESWRKGGGGGGKTDWNAVQPCKIDVPISTRNTTKKCTKREYIRNIYHFYPGACSMASKYYKVCDKLDCLQYSAFL